MFLSTDDIHHDRGHYSLSADPLCDNRYIESSQWLRKNIVQSAGIGTSRKAWKGALATII